MTTIPDPSPEPMPGGDPLTEPDIITPGEDPGVTPDVEPDPVPAGEPVPPA